MNFQKVTGKFKGMRKDVDWVIYPHSKTDEYWVIQSKRRIAKVHKKGNTILSKSVENNGFMHLAGFMGAKEVETPQEIFSQLENTQSTGPIVRIM